MVSDQFEPTPAVLIVSEAVVSLPLHHSGTLLIDEPDGEAELPVDGAGVGGVEEDGHGPGSVLA